MPASHISLFNCVYLMYKIILILYMAQLRIDTSGWGVNFGALFHKASIRCFQGLQYVLYIIR